MTRFFILCFAFILCTKSNAQLTVYSGLNMQGNTGICVARTIYTNSSIPNSLNDGIKSISLSQGYMATLAENADGSGERFSYMATVSNLNVNLSLALQNKVSFIRVLALPITPVKKKGAGATSNDERNALNVTWFYDWGFRDFSTATTDFAPMAWGSNAASDANINTVTNKDSVSHYLSFNEPDNAGQANLSVQTAIPLYRKMLRSGYRMGSPAPTESQYRIWLNEFADTAALLKLKLDVVCVHWYDWGYVCGNFNGCDLNDPIAGRTVDMNATNIFNRFKSWVDAVYQLHQKPIWITEFNAHLLRSDAVHAAFMRLALPWLDANPNVERYAYFFGNDAPARNANGTLTEAGQVYSSHASVNAYSENIYDKRPAVQSEVLASWETSGQVQGGRAVASFAPTFLSTNMTAPTALSRGTGVSVPTTAASNGYWGGNEWSTATTASSAVSANKFLRFSLKATNGKNVSYQAINKFNIRMTSNGPVQFQIDYQIDNGLFMPCATVTIARPTGSANFVLDSIDLSHVPDLQEVESNKTITFRITPFEASSTGSSFLIGSGTGDTEADLSVIGSFSDNIILPVTLSKFTSTRIEDKVLLAWETLTESNFSHFSLERSTDGKNFYEIAKINGSQNAVASKYQYTDASPDKNDTNYYRLKMVNTNNSFEYSATLSEVFPSSNTPFIVYPSIATSNKIEAVFSNVSDAAQLKIFNLTGQLLGTYNLKEGTNAQSIDIAHLTEGVYFLTLHDKGIMQSKKFVKQ